MFSQIKAATRMTNWDAQTVIPSFDFLCCHHYQLDIWMKNQLRNFDPFKNRKTNSVIRKSLEEYRTSASSYAAPLLQRCNRGEICVRPPRPYFAVLCLTPSSPGSSTGRWWNAGVFCSLLGPMWEKGLCSSVPLIEHSNPHGLLAALHI